MNPVLPKSGTYVLAVSGGVDSMVLLDLLRQEAAKNSAVHITVAHLDHGIRLDSAEDRVLVQDISRRHGLPFVFQESRLGAGASEADARRARYAFLHNVRQATNARAIITAHHQDDVLETAILNILRGTGRRGITALKDQSLVHRPLLDVSKADLIAYAKDQGLVWRDDSTNENVDYLRNYVRHRLLSRFSSADKKRLKQLIDTLHVTNTELDNALIAAMHQQTVGSKIDRPWYNHLPHDVSKEVLLAWLRVHGVKNIDRKTVERLVVAAKTGNNDSRYDVNGGIYMRVGKANLALEGIER